MKKNLLILALLVAVVAAAVLYLPIFIPGNFKKGDRCVGDISVPSGYERIDGDDMEYSEFLRSIPLKPKGTKVTLFKNGEKAKFSNTISCAVIDLPLLSNAEQCADACIRLRSEYLFRHGKYGRICFKDNAGIPFQYLGGRCRKAFETYLRTVYNVANTSSLCKELPNRDPKEIQPGDILVYKVRPGRKYGHAIMVLDVVQNPKNGRKMVMLAEGCTPACDIHVLANLKNPRKSPWFSWDENAEVQYFDCFKYYKNELRRFK